MDNPFAMSFDELKARADANMKADRGETATPVEAKSAKTKPAEPASGKSFLDLVNEAQQQLNKEETETAAAAVETPAAEPAKESTTSGISFDDMFNQAQSSTLAISFDDMFKQAVANQPVNETPAETSTSEPAAEGASPAAQTEQSASEPVISFEEMLAASEPVISFEKMVAQAQTQTDSKMGADEPYTEAVNPFNGATDPFTAPAEETPAAPETSTEDELAADSASASEETPAAPETSTEDEPAADSASASEDELVLDVIEEKEDLPLTSATSEEPKSAKRGRKKTKAEKPAVEPLPDTTDEYKVDILPAAKPAEMKTEDTAPMKDLSMTALFTAEEIEAFRADIRTLVRNEFKRAMVGAVKELLADFGG